MKEPLPANQLIAHYRILSKLGAGGMGEVYLAEDTKLGRKVALKLLPAEFNRDAGRMRRFEQEARAASALNHPNILTIFEIGEANEGRYIATEFIDGQTLRERLKGDRLAPSAALDIASQIAAALTTAHEAGIVHRDIKPENVMLRRDGVVKVLDFGLAKLTDHNPAAVDSQAPTIAKAHTDPGTVMGTVGYMSPEQVRGQEADHRADIFSFGVILYEMLSGQRAFSGDSAVEVMNAILKEDPPELCETNTKISPQHEKIVRRCLEKKTEHSFTSARVLAFALAALPARSGSRIETQAPAPAVAKNVGASSLQNRERLTWLAVTLLLRMLGFVWTYFTRQPATDTRVFKTSILPPEKSSFEHIAVSPDGRHLAFTAATGGKVQLWVQALDSTEARPLAGTLGATFPFWSPDSRFIGFFAEGWLKKIEVTGGTVQKLCEAGIPYGGAWSNAGVILFRRVSEGLFRVSATGGETTQVTSIDRPRQEIDHFYPAFLPDGRHFLYYVQSGQKETRGVYIGSLDGPRKRRLLDDITPIRYMAAVPGDTAGGAGWLVFKRDDALLARRFDARRLEFTGEAFSLSDKVGSDAIFPTYSTFSVSDNGVLVFDPSLKRQRRQYWWVDRRGQRINSLDAAGGFYQPWLSPEEKRFIADRHDPLTGTQDLWLYEVSGGNPPQRFTFDPANDACPIWSPQGSRIVWASTRVGGIMNLYQQAANGAGEETLLQKTDYPKLPTDWSRDGRFIIYYQADPKTKRDIWVMPAPGSGEEKPRPVVRTEANDTAGTLSPDGRWLAYASDETGRFEVYVQSFPDGGGKRQVTTGGGSAPRWGQKGWELFYYSGDGWLMAAPVRIGESFETGAASQLFEFRAGTIMITFLPPYAVTADGQRFLINTVIEREPNAPLTVVTNWTAGVKK